MRICFNYFQLKCALLFLFTSLWSALSYSQQSGHVFVNAAAGFGVLHGGFGMNAEIGKKHFSVFLASGYAIEREIDNNTIDPTFNFHSGVRYHFNVKSEVIYPRVGVGYGWITNYYPTNRKVDEFDQKTQGLSVHLGTQFLTQIGVIINLDLVASSKHLIINQSRHPDFFNFYLRPSLGLGYEISRLFEPRKNKKVKNKEINLFG